MKTLKKLMVCCIAFAFAVCLCVPNFVQADSSIVTPNKDTATLSWQTPVGEENSYSHSTQVIIGNYIYEASANTLYQIDKSTGTITNQVELAGAITCTDWTNWQDNYAALVAHEDVIYVPILPGRIQAIDTTTMKSLWITESIDGFYNNSQYVYHDGSLYGAMSGSNQGFVFCLDVADTDPASETEAKDFAWRNTNTEGHYWSTPYVSDTHLVIGSDSGNGEDGSLGSVSVYSTLSGEKTDSEVVVGKVRSGVTYDVASDTYYTASNGCNLYRFQVDSTGAISDFASKSLTYALAPENAFTNCTNAPYITNGKIYILTTYSVSGESGTVLHELNSDLEMLAQYVTGEGCTASPRLAVNGSHMYFTLNTGAGPLCYIDVAAENPAIEILYSPEKNYCMDAVLMDENGNLYYTDDSSTAYCITKKVTVTPAPATPTPTPLVITQTPTPDGGSQPDTPIDTAKSGTKLSAPAKVKSLKVKVAKKKSGSKKKVTLSWKKAKKASNYQVYMKKKSGKFKKLLTTKKTKISKKLRPGKYTFKVRAVKKSGKKVAYGKFSKVKKVTIK